MFENLRNEAGFIEDEEPEVPETPAAPQKKKTGAAKPPRRRRRTFDQITGTTPFQRFILASMLFVSVCLLGTMLLMVTEKLALDFLY